MKLRRADAADAVVVAEVYLRSRRASVDAIPASVHPDDEVRTWIADVVLPTQEVWVADLGGEVVAMLVLSDEWIEHLYVDPVHCGTGVGSSLLEQAKQRRPEGLQLWTFAANTGARRFYERHGFVAVEETDGSGNEEQTPDVRYRLDGPAQKP